MTSPWILILAPVSAFPTLANALRGLAYSGSNSVRYSLPCGSRNVRWWLTGGDIEIPPRPKGGVFFAGSAALQSPPTLTDTPRMFSRQVRTNNRPSARYADTHPACAVHSKRYRACPLPLVHIQPRCQSQDCLGVLRRHRRDHVRIFATHAGHCLQTIR